jgi:hypothetical protein
MTSRADTHSTSYHRRAHRRRRQVPTGGGGTTKASKPTRLSCQTTSLFTSAYQSHQQEGRWVGGTVEAPWPPKLQLAPCRHYLRVLDPPTSTTTPPLFTFTSAMPELHRPLQHRLSPAAAPLDLLMAAVDSSSVPWTSPSSDRRRGRGLLRPQGLPGCHPHPATSTSPPPSRPRVSPLASRT